MSQFKYSGTDARVIPSLGLTVNPGDVIDAPDDFDVFNFEQVGTSKKSTFTTTPPSVDTPAVSDPTAVGSV